MFNKKRFAVITMLVLSLPAFAQDTPEKEIKEESVGKRGSYAFGVSFMKNMKSQGVPLDMAAFVQGMQDVSNDKVTLSEEQLQAAFVAFQQVISENAKKEASMAGEKNKKEGVVAGRQKRARVSGCRVFGCRRPRSRQQLFVRSC